MSKIFLCLAICLLGFDLGMSKPKFDKLKGRDYTLTITIIDGNITSQLDENMDHIDFESEHPDAELIFNNLTDMRILEKFLLNTTNATSPSSGNSGVFRFKIQDQAAENEPDEITVDIE